MKFYVSCRKSKVLHVDEFLLSRSYKVSAPKVQNSYLSWNWRMIQSLKKNWLVVLNMTLGIRWIFTQHRKVWKFLFDVLFLPKVCKVWATKIHRSYISQTLNSDAKFQKWHEKLGELSLEYSKVWKFALWWAPFYPKHIKF